ncbi:hypothetical protein K470DRAFT_82290 [Piedraia hortae CBS 480.64]|uniref:Uncharacterized protein n=1 Tax=Piedraia hortae CBS 480.64 TaxID=1314780 RepID=A0A6A7C9U8_9PEZI|nr:hypothetical protein K470DRAFT_82290 [Piedraia hortae CBS 480.64]
MKSNNVKSISIAQNSFAEGQNHTSIICSSSSFHLSPSLRVLLRSCPPIVDMAYVTLLQALDAFPQCLVLPPTTPTLFRGQHFSEHHANGLIIMIASASRSCRHTSPRRQQLTCPAMSAVLCMGTFCAKEADVQPIADKHSLIARDIHEPS